VSELFNGAMHNVKRHLFLLCAFMSESWISFFTIHHTVVLGRMFESVCLSLCLSVCLSVYLCLFVCLQHNSKTNDPKVFKLGIWNDLGIS